MAALLLLNNAVDRHQHPVVMRNGADNSLFLPTFSKIRSDQNFAFKNMAFSEWLFNTTEARSSACLATTASASLPITDMVSSFTQFPPISPKSSKSQTKSSSASQVSLQISRYSKLSKSPAQSKIQTVLNKIKYRVNMYELRENRKMSPKCFKTMVSNLLYERRYDSQN
jgi:hypothetical protein